MSEWRNCNIVITSRQAATHGRGFHCPFCCRTSCGKAVNTNIYCVWFDSPGNRTCVYRFSSRRSIHSTTDRLNFLPPHRKMNIRLSLAHFIITVDFLGYDSDWPSKTIKLYWACWIFGKNQGIKNDRKTVSWNGFIALINCFCVFCLPIILGCMLFIV